MEPIERPVKRQGICTSRLVKSTLMAIYFLVKGKLSIFAEILTMLFSFNLTPNVIHDKFNKMIVIFK
jgi:hypothetical protein